jgi:predicted ester cyclase
MSTIKQTAERFLRNVKPGQGWDAWQPFCHPDASFRKLGTSAVGMEVHESLPEFAESTKLMAALFPDLRQDLRSLAIDEEQNIAIAYLVAEGTHTGEGGPVPPTGKAFEVDVVYVMQFEEDRIRHLTMVMHDLVVDKQLGWA